MGRRGDRGTLPYGSDSKVQPTPCTSLLVVKIDEIDQVARDPVCKQLLSDIASKCRSEAVALIFAGQRGHRPVGRRRGPARQRRHRAARPVRPPGEARKATGEEIDLPDMGAYGEGQPGVWLIYELGGGGGGGYDRGRVFKLENPAEIEAIVVQRLNSRELYVPEPALGRLAGLRDKITGAAPDDDENLAASAPAVGGPVLQGTGRITAKIGKARATDRSRPSL